MTFAVGDRVVRVADGVADESGTVEAVGLRPHVKALGRSWRHDGTPWYRSDPASQLVSETEWETSPRWVEARAAAWRQREQAALFRQQQAERNDRAVGPVIRRARVAVTVEAASEETLCAIEALLGIR